MSATVLEVSEGIPQDGQIFELPQQNLDNGEPRYVTILGSLIDPITANDRSWTKAGGIEVVNPCLNVVRNFIRKGRITPVLKDAHNPINADVWEKATGRDASYFQQPMPAGYVLPTNEYGNPSKVTPMMRKVAFPGDQINSIVNGPHNVRDRSRWGIVELKTLKGQTYTPEDLGNGVITDKAIWQIQKTIFPTWPVLPVLLDDLERLLDAATEHRYLKPIVDEYYASLNQFRDRARATVEQTHYTMRESAAKSPTGYIPRYVDLDFVLLEQLGMARQDINIRQSAPVAPVADTDLREALKQLIALQIEEKQGNIEREKRVSELEVPNVNTMAAAPIAAQAPIKEPKEVTMWKCEACGEEMKSTSKGFHVGRHCKVLHPKVEAETPQEG
jgi:hypothetical protein